MFDRPKGGKDDAHDQFTVRSSGRDHAGGPAAAEVEVNIMPGVAAVEVMHKGEKVVIATQSRIRTNTVNPAFAKTSRKCPPFCIQPTSLGPGVETIGEDEVLRYAKAMSDGDGTIVLVDSRTPDWVERGTIPSGDQPAVDPALNPAKGADPIYDRRDHGEGVFNVKSNEELMDFSECKTAVLFCNGMWCGQSPNNIKNLLKFGYPAHKIKWYRGGDAGLGDPRD